MGNLFGGILDHKGSSDIFFFKYLDGPVFEIISKKGTRGPQIFFRTTLEDVKSNLNVSPFYHYF